MATIRRTMSNVYNSAKICPFYEQDCDVTTSPKALTLDPEIELAMASSRNYDELKYIWTKWHDSTGPLMREDYKEYVSMMNQAAALNDYGDAGLMWQGRYEMDTGFPEMAEALWQQVKPLYDDLHKYVNYKLQEIYPGKWAADSENIPAHVFGNMWAQSWDNLYDDLKPFKKATAVDVTAEMAAKNYTVLKMFEDSNDFYTTLGLEDCEMSYTGKSIIEKPEDRVIACHASAWDFCNGEDYRVKMCTKITQGDYETVHHEMGHIEYFILYKDQPLPFRTGANPGFHEAVGDAISLSVNNPHHLKTIGLLDYYADSEEDNINALFKMALERVAFLPFGYLIDKWRWDVFSGAVQEENWNKHWWDLRRNYQKVTEPEGVRGEDFFDPGAKYHIPADSQYMSYFIAKILQFQFYKSLCIEAGEYDPLKPEDRPLHKCDFYKSEKAGEKFRAGLQLGLSKHWNDALNELVGSPAMSADPLIEYFAPLQTFLKAEIAKIDNDNEIRPRFLEYGRQATEFCTKMVTAEWNQVTDVLSEDKKETLKQAILENAGFVKEQYEVLVKDLKVDDYLSDGIKRMISAASDLHRYALATDDLANFTDVQTRMETVYNDGKVCPYTNKNCNLASDAYWTLNPDLEDVLANSKNPDELLYVFEKWHEVTGKEMREDFKMYVELVDKIAEANGYQEYGQVWRAKYEDDDFETTVQKLWQGVEPLYNELHTYVRHKLIDTYGDLAVVEGDLIPAHLLGNMWAQSWVNLYEQFKPFDTALVDVTTKMVEKGYTPLKMFEESNNFYLSLGLEDSTVSFTGASIIERPEDRVIACHASAWDFCDGTDFRIKQCTKVNMEDFVTAHHEMGHIEYYLLYKDQHLLFRNGANPGFHEAVGDLIALSVSTPKHLAKIGLLDDYVDNRENNINSLFKMALERVAFLPFGLLIDQWRWGVFKGDIPENKWNEEWWNVRKKYQKVSPPNGERGEEFFDPGAKFHVPSDYSYIAYFFAHILEFQLHRSLCVEAGEYDPLNKEELPLHNCDIFNSIQVGDKLRAGLSLGSSVPWPRALQLMTGETELSSDSLVEYFEPLYEFLKEANEKWERAELEDEGEEVSNKIPIIVGAVIGGLLLVALAGYGYHICKKKKSMNTN